MKLLQIDFPYSGPWGEEMAAMHAGLGELIAQTPGLAWKIWTENPKTGEAGGIYLFVDEQSASKYLKEHVARLNGFGIQNVRARLFDVNEGLNKITRATFCEMMRGHSAS